MQVKIADIYIEVFTLNTNIKLVLSDNYASFVCPEKKKPDISIEVKAEIPPEFFKTEEIYKAKHEGSHNDSAYFWSIHKLDKQKRIVFTSDPGNLQFPFLALVFSEKNRNWQLFISEKNRSETDPFVYPMGPLIMYYAATFNNALMIHGSGVSLNNNGYVFSGVSGIGKSTMAALWQKTGADVINDDRLIIRKKNDGFYVYNTPMYYPDKPKKMKLNKLFLLHQDKKNNSHQIFGANAIAGILANCIHHNYSKLFLNNLISILSELVSKTGIYKLGFIPETSVVTYILENEQIGK